MIKFDGFKLFIAFLFQCTIIVTAYIPTNIVAQDNKNYVISLFAALTMGYISDAFYGHRKEKKNNRDTQTKCDEEKTLQ